MEGTPAITRMIKNEATSEEHGSREDILCIFNLSHAPQPAELDLSAFRGRVPVESPALAGPGGQRKNRFCHDADDTGGCYR